MTSSMVLSLFILLVLVIFLLRLPRARSEDLSGFGFRTATIPVREIENFEISRLGMFRGKAGQFFEHHEKGPIYVKEFYIFTGRAGIHAKVNLVYLPHLRFNFRLLGLNRKVGAQYGERIKPRLVRCGEDESFCEGKITKEMEVVRSRYRCDGLAFEFSPSGSVFLIHSPLTVKDFLGKIVGPSKNAL